MPKNRRGKLRLFPTRIATDEREPQLGHRASVRQGDIENPDVDSVQLGIQPKDVPIVNVMIKKVERSSDGSPPLNQGEAKDLVEILDKVRTFHKIPSALNPRRSGPIFRETW